MEKLKDEFENSAKVFVSFEKPPYAEFIKNANQDFGSQTGLYDISLQYPFALPTYVGSNLILPSSKYSEYIDSTQLLPTESSFFPNIWKEVGWYRLSSKDKAEPVGYPFAANTVLLCYNKSLFEDATHQANFQAKYKETLDVPKTWEQFHNIVEYFGSIQGLSGICMQGQDGGWLYWEWCNYAFGFGGGVMKKDYGWESSPNIPLIIASPETIKGTEFWLSLKQYNASTDFFSTGMQQQIDLMRKGKTALALLWSDQAYNFLYGENANKSYASEFGFAPIPGNKSMIGGGIFMVNKSSRRPKEAIEYILHVLKPESQAKLMQQGLCSPLMTVYDMKEVKDIPYATALKDSLIRATYMLDAGPDGDAIMTIMTKYLQMIWMGQLNVEDALKTAQTEIVVERQKIFEALAKALKKQ